jgi:HK97 family phage prohead protease
MPAVPVHHTPTSSSGWDGPEQESNLETPLTKAIGDDSFAWVDPDADETTKGAWRFVHHFITNHKPGAASTAGCSAGIAALNGARGGTTIPEADRKGVYAHLAAHLKDHGVKEVDLPELKAVDEIHETRADTKDCPTCEGSGKIKGGSTTCPDCGGDGTVSADSESNALNADVERRKKRASELRGRERRTVDTGPVEVRDAPDGKLQLSGYASIFDRPYDVGWYQETIKRGAFSKTLSDGAQVHLLLNHGGLPLASTQNGSLSLREDGVGLKVEASLDPDDPDSQTVIRKVRSGLMNEMSFAFQAIRQNWDDDYTRRELTEVSIDKGDVSVVNFGANPSTSVATRGALDDFERRAVDFALELIDSEERAGASLSSANLAKIKTALSLVADADTGVDKAQVVLSELAGVTNPDIAQDKKLNYTDPSANADGESDAPAASSRSIVLPNYAMESRQRLAAMRARGEA